MKILDESGLTHYSQRLSRTNKVIVLKNTYINANDSAKSIMPTAIQTIATNLEKLNKTNNATFIVKDKSDNTRGVASYIGNGGSTINKSVGYIEMYVFDSGNTYAQAKIMVNNGTVKKMS